MTIKEFLGVVENRIANGDWRARFFGQKVEVQFKPRALWVSPVEAMCREKTGYYPWDPEIAAQSLGIPARHIDNLVAAIYGHGGEPSLRRRLLKACGLEEAKP